VTTTGIHLASRQGHALERAFKGKAQYRYGDTQSADDAGSTTQILNL
jgi:hypothetical protein